MVRKRSHLSAEEKYQIFLEAAMAKGNGSISEVMRRWAIHSSDLTRIRKSVEEAAISNFKAKKSRKPKIDYEQHQELKAEKERLEHTIIEQAAELALTQKKRSLGLDGDLKGKYIDEGTKKALVKVITETKEKHSLTINYSCQKLQVDKKRYQRWVRLQRKTGRYGGGRPGPKKTTTQASSRGEGGYHQVCQKMKHIWISLTGSLR